MGLADVHRPSDPSSVSARLQFFLTEVVGLLLVTAVLLDTSAKLAVAQRASMLFGRILLSWLLITKRSK